MNLRTGPMSPAAAALENHIAIGVLDPDTAREGRHPSEKESARRGRGETRVNYRTTDEIKLKLLELAQDDDCELSEMLDLLVNGEWEHRREQRRIAAHKTRKPRSA